MDPQINTDADIASDLVKGVDAIASYIKEPRRRVYYLAERKQIPVFKMGGIWYLRKSTFRRHVEQLEAAAMMGAA
jgi:hypothetical protein